MTDPQEPEWISGDPATVARLKFRYALLRQVITELRNKLAETNPEVHRTAPPPEVFLAALESQTASKSTDQMSDFVDKELKRAFYDIPPDHPIKLELRKRFRKEVDAIIPIIADKIRSGETFDSIMAFLARERRRIAEEVCDLPSKNFGVSRESRQPRMERTIYTAKGRFRHYHDKVLPLFSEGVKEFVIPSSFDRFVGNALADRMEGFTLWADLRGERIPLSTYLIMREAPNDYGLDWFFCDDYNDWPAVSIVHTEEHLLPLVRAFCSDLFEAIKKQELSKEQLIDAAAELQWYLAHSMFYTRGSAAIAEWLITGLFLSKGYIVTWSKQPDLEALCCLDPATFVAHYRSFATVKKKSEDRSQNEDLRPDKGP